MSKEVAALEAEAVAAHQRGETWNQFFAWHGQQIAEAEPYNRQRYRRLVRRLLALLTSGHGEVVPPNPCPWEQDDEAG